MINDKRQTTLSELREITNFIEQETKLGYSIKVVNSGYCGRPSIFSEKFIPNGDESFWVIQNAKWIDKNFWREKKKEIRKLAGCA